MIKVFQISRISRAALFVFAAVSIAFAQDKAPAEKRIEGPGGLPITVRMQGPFDADVPLQVVCYFKRTLSSDSRLFGAPVELDRQLGGVIASLRERGEFKGDEFETFLIKPADGSIKPKQLLLIGLGNEVDLTLERMEAVGRTALREAVRLNATRVAFAPLIKDAGNDKLAAGDVEQAVVFGMLLAYDTELRLQKQQLASAYELDEWIVEAGPMFYSETINGVTRAAKQAMDATSQRESKNYATTAP